MPTAAPREFTAATWNGAVSTKARDYIHDAADLVRLAGVVGVQEGSTRTEEHADLERTGRVQVWAGDGSPGAAAVPILWDPRRYDLQHAATIPLTPATWTGKTPKVAGPPRVKAKPLNVVVLRDRTAPPGSGDRTVTNLHMPASLWFPPRARLGAQVIARLLAEVDDLGAPVWVTADWNAVPGRDRILEPLDRAGLASAQLARRPVVPTKGRRAIDDVRHKGRWVCHHRHAVRNHSDHHALVTEWRRRPII